MKSPLAVLGVLATRTLASCLWPDDSPGRVLLQLEGMTEAALPLLAGESEQSISRCRRRHPHYRFIIALLVLLSLTTFTQTCVRLHSAAGVGITCVADIQRSGTTPSGLDQAAR